MISDLADLLAPASTSEFLDALRASRRMHVRTAKPTRFELLLPWQEIETLLDQLARADKLPLLRDGHPVPGEFYRPPGGNEFSTQAFHKLATQGVSVVIKYISNSVPRIGHLAASIERELGIRAWVNAYLSLSKGGAFKPHVDTHDVLILQIYGIKRWRIWKAEVACPVKEMPDAKINGNSQPDQLIELAPGDVLFVPRGEAHAAAVSSGTSVHLTIGLDHKTSLDFFGHLREKAMANPLFRMNLPRHSRAEESAEQENALKQALFELVDTTGIAEFLAADDLRRRPYLHTTISAAIPKPDDLLGLTLRRRIPLPNLTSDSEPQQVTIGGEVFVLSPASIDAIRWLFDNGLVRRRDLDDILVPRYGLAAIEASLGELLRLGLLAIDPLR
jgi:hypothetical protein